MNRALIAVLILALGCSKETKVAAAARSTGGNVDAGRAAIDKYGCTACHIIPGVDGPRGMVGPSLEHFSNRKVIAGKMPNNPQTLITWIQNPQAMDPQSAMPNLGVTPADARDLAAYIYAQP
jgi:cytochrome c